MIIKLLAGAMLLEMGLPVQSAVVDPLLNRSAPAFVPPRDPSGSSSPQSVSARVETFGIQLQYVALCLDGDGEDRLYIKVQQKDSSGLFGTAGFYHGEGSPIPGLTGGPAFYSLSAQFKSADMRVDHDGAGNIKLTFSQLSPPGPDQVYERGGWQPRNGSQFGIAGYTGIAGLDDFTIDPDRICDRFNRPDGPLGDDWMLAAGPGGLIRDGRAFVGTNNTRARFVYVGPCTTCSYALTRSKARNGCLTCPPLGDGYRTLAGCVHRRECQRRLRATIECPAGVGSCRIKGKRSACD